MTTEIRVPQLPESVADATLVAWHKQPGDAVTRDENLADLETDKVVLEVPAPANGVVQGAESAERRHGHERAGARDPRGRRSRGCGRCQSAAAAAGSPRQRAPSRAPPAAAAKGAAADAAKDADKLSPVGPAPGRGESSSIRAAFPARAATAA